MYQHNLIDYFLNVDKAKIAAFALLSLFVVQTIFDNIFLYQANSKTLLTEDQAFNQVPGAAGINLTTADLYFITLG
jgi:hypothetical protein